MNTARLNQGTPLLLNGVTKRYGENTILNALDLHIPAGQFVAVVGAAAAEKYVAAAVSRAGSAKRRRAVGRKYPACRYSG
jgi:ABC-type ATPase with predicted acetyltransferase domain